MKKGERFMGDAKVSPKISIVVLSYNTRVLLRQCLSSIQPGLEDCDQDVSVCDYEVIVVDNASSDGSPEMVRSKFPSAVLLINDTNEGFARAVNRGVEVSHGEFILVSNSDVVYPPGSIAEMIHFAIFHPNVGVVGPQLVYPDGSWQQSYGTVPSIGASLKCLFFLFSLHNGIRRLLWPTVKIDLRPKHVGYIPGAAMLIRKKAFDAVGGFDEDFFFYGEDVDFCMRLRKLGWDVVFLPKSRVIHVHGGSSTKVCPDDRFLRLQVQSNVLFLRKHYPDWKVRLVLVLQLGYCVLRKFESYLLSLLPSKRVREFFRQRGEVFSILSGLWGEQLSQFKPTIFSRVEKK